MSLHFVIKGKLLCKALWLSNRDGSALVSPLVSSLT